MEDTPSPSSEPSRRPRPMFDDRVDCAVLVTEKALLRRNKRVKVLRRTELSKRWASDILADFGPKDCPTGMVISPELFREAREALGWSQAEAAWKLGYERRSGPTIRNLGAGSLDSSTLRSDPDDAGTGAVSSQTEEDILLCESSWNEGERWSIKIHLRRKSRPRS